MSSQLTEPRVAYIIVGWNNQKLLHDCFKSVMQQEYKNYVIVYIDNNSSDESVAYVKASFPNVVVLEQDKNHGFAKANNIAIKHLVAEDEIDYFAFINSDARITPEWTSQIVSFAANKPRGACFQGTTLDYYNHQVVDSTHIYMARNGQGTQGSWRLYNMHEFGPKKIFGVNAAAAIISREFIEAQPFRQEFFDETLFMYLEDVDVAIRATVMGWDNYLVPRARAFHMGSASSNKFPGLSLYLTFRNNSAVLYKNYPLRIILKILPKLIRGDIDTIRTLRHRKQTRAIPKVVKGRIVGILKLPLFIGKRHLMLRNFRLDRDYLWHLMKKGY